MHPGAHPSEANGFIETLSKEELIARAEQEAQGMLRMSFSEALKALDEGRYSGTVAAARLTARRLMLGL